MLTKASESHPSKRSLAVMVAGDVAAILAFVAIGLESHHILQDYALNLVRVSAPFLAGWFIASPLSGAYRLATLRRPRELMARSALSWFVGISFGLILRDTVFHESFSLTFSLITLLFTGLFILGWRTVFTVVTNKFVWSAPRSKADLRDKTRVA